MSPRRTDVVVMAPLSRTRIAFHETGHAVTAMAMQVKFTRVSLPLEPEVLPAEDGARIIAAGVNDIGYRAKPDPKDAFNEIAVLLAGSVAECIWLSKQAEQPSSEALAWLLIAGQDDLLKARKRLLALNADPNYIAEAIWFNHRSLNLNWRFVCRVAEELLNRGELTREQIATIGQAHPST
jgi:hypothetical protein